MDLASSIKSLDEKPKARNVFSPVHLPGQSSFFSPVERKNKSFFNSPVLVSSFDSRNCNETEIAR